MKSHQFFKINKRFDKEREKTLIQQSMRKEKLRKYGLCVITGYFIKPFKMTINHFFFNRSFCSQDFCFLFPKLVRSAIFVFYYQDDAGNIKRGNWERQIARNGKLQYSFRKQFQSFSNERNINKFSLLIKCACMTTLN